MSLPIARVKQAKAEWAMVRQLRARYRRPEAALRALANDVADVEMYEALLGVARWLADDTYRPVEVRRAGWGLW